MARGKEQSPHLIELKQIFAAKGVTSPEFAEKVRLFFVWLEYKYIGRRNPDLEQRMYERLLESMKYFDPTKISNIGSWAYSVGRHQISSFLYELKKQNRHSEDGLVNLIDENDHFLSMEIEDFISGALQRFEMMEIEEHVHGSFLEDMKRPDKNNPLVKAVLWDLQSSALSASGRPRK